MVQTLLHQVVDIAALPPGVAFKGDTPKAGSDDRQTERLNPNLLNAVLRVSRKVKIATAETIQLIRLAPIALLGQLFLENETRENLLHVPPKFLIALYKEIQRA